MQRHSHISLANTLRIWWVALGFLIASLLLTEQSSYLPAALALMIVAAAVQIWSGMYAGGADGVQPASLLDPACESIYHFAIYVAMMTLGWIAPWMLFFFFGRDLFVPYLRSFARQRGIELTSRASNRLAGAINTVAQIALVVVAIGYVPSAVSVTSALLYMAVAASIFTIVDHTLAIIRPQALLDGHSEGRHPN